MLLHHSHLLSVCRLVSATKNHLSVTHRNTRNKGKAKQPSKACSRTQTRLASTFGQRGFGLFLLVGASQSEELGYSVQNRREIRAFAGLTCFSRKKKKKTHFLHSDLVWSHHANCLNFQCLVVFSLEDICYIM